MFGRLGVRRAGSVGLVAFGAAAHARAAAAGRQSPGSSRCAGRWPRASRPTVSSTSTGSRTRCAALGGWPGSPGWCVAISDFRDQRGWERPLGSLRIASFGARGRDRRTRASPSCRRPATWRWSTPRAARGSRSTRPGRACAGALRSSSASGVTAVARELRRLRRRPRGAVHRRGLAAGAWAPPAMSFSSPLWLLGLALVPLAIAARFAAPATRDALRDPLHRGADAAARGAGRALAVARTSRPRFCWRRPQRWCWRSRGRT